VAKYRVLWTRTARLDLENIIDYIAADNIAAAATVLKRIQRRTQQLVRFPARGRIVPELREIDVLIYRELAEPPWRIIYRYEHDRVLVLAVLDSRRNLTGLLLERLVRV